MRVFAVAQRLRQRAAKGAAARRPMPTAPAIQVLTRRVIGGGAGIGVCARRWRMGKVSGRCASSPPAGGVVLDIDDHADKAVVLGRRADHRRAADVDVLDARRHNPRPWRRFPQTGRGSPPPDRCRRCHVPPSLPRCSALSRSASRPPCTTGCRVLTRPSIISGKPVTSATSRTSSPASRSALAVPPVDSNSTPRAKPAQIRPVRSCPKQKAGRVLRGKIRHGRGPLVSLRRDRVVYDQITHANRSFLRFGQGPPDPRGIG